MSDFGPVPNKNNKIMSPRTLPGCKKHSVNTFQKISGLTTLLLGSGKRELSPLLTREEGAATVGGAVTPAAVRVVGKRGACWVSKMAATLDTI